MRVNDLLVLARGFPCRWLAAALTARGIPFCIRCDISRGFRVVRQFMLSGQSEQVVTLRTPNARDVEAYECPATPTMVRRLKHRLGLEHTSGLSWHAANQDFGAKAVFDKLNALAAYVATETHLEPDSHWKINRTLMIDKIKRRIGRWLLAAGATMRRLKPLIQEIAANLQKFVAG